MRGDHAPYGKTLSERYALRFAPDPPPKAGANGPDVGRIFKVDRLPNGGPDVSAPTLGSGANLSVLHVARAED